MDARPVPPEFCSAPWKVLHVSPQGDVYSCYESTESLGNVHKASLEEIWHGPAFVALRQKMLSGQRVAACEKCHIKADAIEGRSLRTLTNEKTGGDAAVSALYLRAEEKPDLAPEILDLSFSNTCNLKCRMCSSKYSKAWIEDETRAYGSASGEARELTETQIESEIFPLLSGVRRILLAGGEPVFDKKNKILLRRLIEIGRTDVEILYNTNATAVDEETLALWREFPDLSLWLSLDSSGARFEYLRKGARWQKVIETLAKLRSGVPQAKLACYSTVSMYNVLTHPGFMREILDSKLFTVDEMELHYLVEPRHLSVRTLPAQAKERASETYFAFIREELLLKQDFEASKKLILQIKMLLNYMRSGEGSTLAEFFSATERIDQIRGESVRATFPELADLG